VCLSVCVCVEVWHTQPDKMSFSLSSQDVFVCVLLLLLKGLKG